MSKQMEMNTIAAFLGVESAYDNVRIDILEENERKGMSIQNNQLCTGMEKK